MYRQKKASRAMLFGRSVPLAAAMWISASGLPAQTATVLADGTPVYARMSAQGNAAATLPKGQEVKIQMTVSGASGCWLDVTWDKAPVRNGYVQCDSVALSATTQARVASLPQSNEKTDRIDELLVVSGASRFIQAATNKSSLSFLSNTGRIDESDPQVRRVFEQTLREETFYSAIRVDFRAYESSDQVTWLLEQFQSPLIKRIVDLEVRASSPGARPDFVRYSASLKARPPSPARLRLIERVEGASGDAEALTEISVARTRGAVRALNEVLPASRRIPYETLEQAVAAQRTRGSTDLAQAVRDLHFYAYSPLTDRELEDYVAFLESAPAKWFRQTIRQSYQRVAENISGEIAAGIARVASSESPPLKSLSEAWTIQDLYDQGVRLLDAEQYLEAIRYLDQAILARPTYAIAYYKRGNAYYSIGRVAKSIEDYTKAVQYDPSLTLAYVNRGVSHADLNQTQLAVEDYSAAIQSNPQVAMAWQNRGNVYYQAGDYRSAVNDYGHVIRLTPGDSEAYRSRGLAYAQLKQWDRSLEDCQSAIKLDPKNAEAYQCAGYALSSKRDYPGSIAAYTRSIELAPKTAAVYDARAWTFEQLGQMDSALKDYSSAIRLDPRDAPAHCNRARILMVGGRAAEAKPDLPFCPSAKN